MGLLVGAGGSRWSGAGGQVSLYCLDPDLQSTLGSQFLHDVRHVVLYGLFLDPQGLGYLLVSHSLRQSLDDIQLANGNRCRTPYTPVADAAIDDGRKPRSSRNLTGSYRGGMNSRIRLLVLAAAAAAVVAFVKRPVKPPNTTGSWHPAESQPSRR